MKKATILTVCLWSVMLLNAQERRWQVLGQVVDSAGAALSGATIILDGSVKAVTHKDGLFAVSGRSRPQMLDIRMVGYQSHRISLDTAEWKDQKLSLTIIMRQAITLLGEALVSASPIQVVFEEDYSMDLLDFRLVDPDFLLLLLKSKRKTLLRLTNEKGAVQAELRLPDGALPHALHRCCTGTYHVVGDQWSWELILKGDKMDTLGRYPSTDFYKYVEPCQALVDGIYFFRKMGPFGQSVRYTWVDQSGQAHSLVHIIDRSGEDEALRLISGFKNREGYSAPRAYELDPSGAFNTAPVEHDLELQLESIDLKDTVGVQGMAYYNDDQMAFLSNLDGLRSDSMYVPMFVWRDTVLLFNHPEGHLMRIKPISTQTETTLAIKKIDIHYQEDKGWKKQIIMDARLLRAYARFLSASKGLVIKEIDVGTGSVNRKYAIPNTPYLAGKHQIRDGNLFFIGQPDVTIPNQRLYKVDLFQYRSN